MRRSIVHVSSFSSASSAWRPGWNQASRRRPRHHVGGRHASVPPTRAGPTAAAAPPFQHPHPPPRTPAPPHGPIPGPKISSASASAAPSEAPQRPPSRASRRRRLCPHARRCSAVQCGATLQQWPVLYHTSMYFVPEACALHKFMEYGNSVCLQHRPPILLLQSVVAPQLY